MPFEKTLNVLTDDCLLINSLLKETTDKILNCLLRRRFMVAENASFRNGMLLKRRLNVIINDRPSIGTTKP